MRTRCDKDRRVESTSQHVANADDADDDDYYVFILHSKAHILTFLSLSLSRSQKTANWVSAHFMAFALQQQVHRPHAIYLFSDDSFGCWNCWKAMAVVRTHPH